MKDIHLPLKRGLEIDDNTEPEECMFSTFGRKQIYSFWRGMESSAEEA